MSNRDTIRSPKTSLRIQTLRDAISHIDHLRSNALFAFPPDAFAIPVQLTQKDLRALHAVLYAASAHRRMMEIQGGHQSKSPNSKPNPWADAARARKREAKAEALRAADASTKEIPDAKI
jgi:hypothetical protein